MALRIDARILIVFGADRAAGDIVLTPTALWADSHPAACACCGARGPAALALDQLFLDRVRGVVPWFTRVVVPESGEAAVRAALTDDPVTAARFRFG